MPVQYRADEAEDPDDLPAHLDAVSFDDLGRNLAHEVKVIVSDAGMGAPRRAPAPAVGVEVERRDAWIWGRRHGGRKRGSTSASGKTLTMKTEMQQYDHDDHLHACIDLILPAQDQRIDISRVTSDVRKRASERVIEGCGANTMMPFHRWSSCSYYSRLQHHRIQPPVPTIVEALTLESHIHLQKTITEYRRGICSVQFLLRILIQNFC